jgi:hypothetical protein
MPRNEPAALDERSCLAGRAYGAGRSRERQRALAAVLAAIAMGAPLLHSEAAFAEAPSADPPSAEAPGAAAPSSALSLALPSCPRTPYDPIELREALAIELQQRHLDPSALSRIELAGCAAGADASREPPAVARLELRVFDADAALVLQRAIRLDDTPFEARSRLLALWIAESLAARRERSASALADSPTAARDSPAPEDGDDLDALNDLDDAGDLFGDSFLLQPSPEHLGADAIELGAALQARFPLSDLASFWGVEANLGGPIAGYFRWAFEAAIAVHSERTPLGELHVTWTSARAGMDFAGRGAVLLSLGPRLSLAHISAGGENSLGITSIEQNANIVSLGARASVGTAIGRGWQFAASLAVEHALRGLVITAGRERTVSLDGWLGEAGVGLRYGF